MTPTPPPLQVVSYTQLRLVAGDATEGAGSVRRFRVNLSQTPTRSERIFVQLFTKANNQSGTDERLWLHDVSWRKRTAQGAWTIGQFRPPFSLQRLMTDRELRVPDRATASDLLSPSGGLAQSFGRDLGIEWEGRDIRLGLFQGRGALQQASFGVSAPLLVGRVTQNLGGVQWGGSLAVRHARQANLSKVFAGAKSFSGWDTRRGVDVQAQYGAWRLSAEWLVGTLAGNLRRRAEGGYADLTRALDPQHELVVQVQTYTPNIGTNGVTLGLNLVPHDPRNRIQLSYKVQRLHRIELQVQQFLTKK